MNPELKMADAIRNVTMAVHLAIEDGNRSRVIDANDLVEVLLAIADQLDPPLSGLIESGDSAPVQLHGWPRRRPRGPNAGSRVTVGTFSFHRSLNADTGQRRRSHGWRAARQSR